MSKYREQLKERLSKALGKDCGDVIDELYSLNVLDDNLARRGCLVHEYLLNATDTSRSETLILSEIADMFGVHERWAWKLVSGHRE